MLSSVWVNAAADRHKENIDVMMYFTMLCRQIKVTRGCITFVKNTRPAKKFLLNGNCDYFCATYMEYTMHIHHHHTSPQG